MLQFIASLPAEVQALLIYLSPFALLFAGLATDRVIERLRYGKEL